MRIDGLSIKHFRCLKDVSLDLSQLTAFVGRNGAGKSSVIKALDLFYDASESVSEADFYNRDTSKEISIAVTFVGLPNEAEELFSKYIADDGSLTVEKVIRGNGGNVESRYHGAKPRNPDFEPIRAGFEIKDRGATAKAALESLRSSGKYDNLPEWSTIGGTKEALEEWEGQNPDECERMRDDGQFFGFRQVGTGYLGRYTRLLSVPAVRDPADVAEEGRGSVFSNLMDLVVRSVLSQRSELREFQERVGTEYQELVAPDKVPELSELQQELSEGLRIFVPSADVRLEWQPLDKLQIPMPQARIDLVEDGYASTVNRCGHGLQRAFVMTMLQRLLLARAADESEESGESDAGKRSSELQLPNLVLAIEEPELYQHPNRQRRFARILWDLAHEEVPGVAEQIQVLYSTHSPHFVGIDRIDELRLLRKANGPEDAPRVSVVSSTDLDAVAKIIWKSIGSPGKPFTGATLIPRLGNLMTPWMNEGFFADGVVLVEGDVDRAAVLAMARVMEKDLEARGVAVIPCRGKNNLDRPLVIFGELNIPVFVMWDGDKDKGEGADTNRQLLCLLGEEEEDWPSETGSRYCCFENTLETYLENEMGVEAYRTALEEARERYGLESNEQAKKNVKCVERVIQRALEAELDFSKLRHVVSSTCKLAGTHNR